jgi:putative aldouronate transport system substrate-binding protein
MFTPLSRRTLVSGAAAGAGIAAGLPLLASAQATPGASPAAEVDPDFLAAQEELIATLQGQSGKKLRILSAVVGGKTPEEDALFSQEIQRLTGIEVELVHPTADYNEKLLADLAAGVEYDLIYTNKDTVDTFVEDGILTDLTERIANSAILSNPTVIPDAEWELVNYDGTYYTVFNKFEGARMLTVRQDWLDQLGLEAPETLDEVYNTMVAFRDQDPAGNGEGATLGLALAGTYDIQPFLSSEGILPGYVEVDGKRTIPWASEAAIPVYEWLANLYAEGLLDPNFATATTADARNLFLTDKVGFVSYWDTWVGLFNNARQT